MQQPHNSKCNRLTVETRPFARAGFQSRPRVPGVCACVPPTACFLEQELVLRDNLLKKIPPVGPLVSLTLLDLSYNEITSMEGIGAVSTGLQQLFLASNQITEIQELDKLGSLAMLELGSNKIRVSGSPCFSSTGLQHEGR